MLTEQNKDVRSKVLDAFSSDQEEEVISEYMSFEPFDVEKRPPWVLEQMREDNVDIYHESVIDVIKPDPHLFQTGYMLSTDPQRVLIASSRSGKSHCALMDAIIMGTRIVPYSLTVPKGVDTGKKRPKTKLNINRWGRRDIISGGFLDNNVNARDDGTWDCGTIIGVGVYPSEKFCPYGGQIWIGSTAQALLKYWWPKVFRGKKMMIPHEAIDVTKGSNGYHSTNHITHLNHDIDIIFTSYESQYDKFEAEEAWAVILDEEPPNEKVLPAAVSHATFMSIVETPYRGITYSENYIFNKDPEKRPEVFHCCAYDSPYRPKSKIISDRKAFKIWDIKARIWGLFSEITGEPYYDREKLLIWLDQLKVDEKNPDILTYAKLIPQDEYVCMKDLTEIMIKPDTVDELNEQDVWRIFEHPRPNIGYLAGVDIAEGAEVPEEAADRQAVCIIRPPMPGTDETKPVKVASLRSTLPVEQFAHVSMHGAVYYNNAVLAPETKHGFANGAYFVMVMDYPYFFHMMTTNDKTRRAQKTLGWVPSEKRRDILFKLMESPINEFEATDPCPFKDIDLLKELAMAIVGKAGRCDHTRKGSLDTAVAHGITLYVWEVSPEQIVCNKRDKPGEFDQPFSQLMDRLAGYPSKEKNKPKHLCENLN